MIPTIISSTYLLGLLATFAYLILSLRVGVSEPSVYRALVRDNWRANLAFSSVWCVLLPFFGIYEGVKKVGRWVGLYRGF